MTMSERTEAARPDVAWVPAFERWLEEEPQEADEDVLGLTFRAGFKAARAEYAPLVAAARAVASGYDDYDYTLDPDRVSDLRAALEQVDGATNLR